MYRGRVTTMLVSALMLLCLAHTVRPDTVSLTENLVLGEVRVRCRFQLVYTGERVLAGQSSASCWPRGARGRGRVSLPGPAGLQFSVVLVAAGGGSRVRGGSVTRPAPAPHWSQLPPPANTTRCQCQCRCGPSGHCSCGCDCPDRGGRERPVGEEECGPGYSRLCPMDGSYCPATSLALCPVTQEEPAEIGVLETTEVAIGLIEMLYLEEPSECGGGGGG